SSHGATRLVPRLGSNRKSRRELLSTAEASWATTKSVGMWNFLDHFRGISQRFLHLRVARDEFLRNYGHLHWRQTFEASLRCLFSTTGDYWRRMTHQHRRMPLTLCYR